VGAAETCADLFEGFAAEQRSTCFSVPLPLEALSIQRACTLMRRLVKTAGDQVGRLVASIEADGNAMVLRTASAETRATVRAVNDLVDAVDMATRCAVASSRDRVTAARLESEAATADAVTAFDELAGGGTRVSSETLRSRGLAVLKRVVEADDVAASAVTTSLKVSSAALSVVLRLLEAGSIHLCACFRDVILCSTANAAVPQWVLATATTDAVLLRSIAKAIVVAVSAHSAARSTLFGAAERCAEAARDRARRVAFATLPSYDLAQHILAQHRAAVSTVGVLPLRQKWAAKDLRLLTTALRDAARAKRDEAEELLQWHHSDVMTVQSTLSADRLSEEEAAVRLNRLRILQEEEWAEFHSDVARTLQKVVRGYPLLSATAPLRALVKDAVESAEMEFTSAFPQYLDRSDPAVRQRLESDVSRLRLRKEDSSVFVRLVSGGHEVSELEAAVRAEREAWMQAEARDATRRRRRDASPKTVFATSPKKLPTAAPPPPSQSGKSSKRDKGKSSSRR